MDFKNDKAKLILLANLMNEQSESPVMVTDNLVYVMDAALEPEEVDFLLKMGGGSRTRGDVGERVGLTKEEFDRVFDTLLDKGHIAQPVPAEGTAEPTYHLMSILPGWFELYLMRGSETPDRREFARRVTQFFSFASTFPADVINEMLRHSAPHRSVVAVNPPEPTLIAINEAVKPPVNEIYPAHSILGIIERLDDNEVITLGYCFCRQQRDLDGDFCRLDLPAESCISLGPAAEHLINRGMARRITKEEALKFIKEVQEKGAVHQVGRLMPLKDVYHKYEVDVICNCCWDCCGAFGNYSRGNLPFMLKSYYIAEIPDKDVCSGCGTCEEFCPVRAIAVNRDGFAEVDPKMCCGCGLCVLHCPNRNVQLRPFERDVFLPILERSQRRIP